MLISLLNNIVIKPIEMIFDAIFCFLQGFPGIAIVAISVVMNFLALPLYRRADAIQEEERRKTADMSRWVNHIKKTFRGDERYMMLTEYYRTEHYKPVYALKSLFPLLLQIPFFIAAYHYLSTQTLLSGVRFLFLKDLGRPDELLKAGSMTFNIMPVVMTLINLLSAYIYLRGTPLKDKIQTYGIALIFLVLLYNSPSGLVFYWTLNQVFSAAKNIFMKLVKRQKTRNLIFAAGGAAAVILGALLGLLGTRRRRLFAAVLFIICCLSLILSGLKKKYAGKMRPAERIASRYFLLGAAFLSLFMGILIPLAVISSDPGEFMTIITKPGRLVFNNVSIYAGFFVFWLGIYYYLSGTRIRNLFTIAVWLLTGTCLVNYLFFAGDYGIMSSDFIFDNSPVINRSEILINLLVMLLLAVVLLLVFRRFRTALPYVYTVLLVSCLGLSAYYALSVRRATRIPDQAEISEGNETIAANTASALSFSRNGKNVVVFVVDKAMGAYIPFILDEKPELRDEFRGFVYYPNTLSYGVVTKWGIPGLYGGHEYSPLALNERPDETLADKHDEALKVMPALFSENDYDVTVWGTILAGYGDPEKAASLYDFNRNIKRFSLDDSYVEPYLENFGSSIGAAKAENLVFFCIFRTAPLILRSPVYHNGEYWHTSSIRFTEGFLNDYAALTALNDITVSEETEDNHFLMLYNSLPHQPAPLSAPNYAPDTESEIGLGSVEHSLREAEGQILHMDSFTRNNTYASNAATLIKLGEWLEYLKEQGVYDNTRIIIASDHGAILGGQLEGTFTPGGIDWEGLNALLLVKDFNSSEEFSTSGEFHMNADVPALAAKDIIPDPENPFTRNPLTDGSLSEYAVVTYVNDWQLSTSEKLFDPSSGSVWSFRKGNIFDPGNWQQIQ